MQEIWYFASAFTSAEDQQIRRLMGDVQKRWAIRYREIDARGRVIQEDLYQKYFAPSGVARLLSQRTGRRVEQELKSRVGKPYIRGIVAIAEADTLQWYGSGNEARRFLRNLLRRGPDLISEIYEQTRSYADKETMLLDEFEARGLIAGEYQRRAWVGYALRDQFPSVTLKQADAVCKGRNGQYWAIEAEGELNHMAIGQAKVYRYLLSRDNPGTDVRAAIVCGSATEDLLAVCKDNGIEVFVIDL